MTMQLQMKVNFDKTALARMAESFPKAGAAALNRVIRDASTDAFTKLDQKYRLPKGSFSKLVRYTNASSAHLKAIMRLSGARIPLKLFNARQTKSGVSVEVTAGKRVILTHTFLAMMKSGHVGVFVRKVIGKGSMKGMLATSRRAIVERFTLSFPEFFNTKAMAEEFKAYATARLPGELTRVIKAFHAIGKE